MYFQTANASFKTSWKWDKSVTGMTELYLNEDLFYADGFKLTVTNGANNLIPFTEVRTVKNYLQIQLNDQASLVNGETIKLNLTPTLTQGQASDSHSENGYALQWTVTDEGATATCSFDVSFSDDLQGEKVYAELVTVGDVSSRLSADKTKRDPCIYMSGGYVRLMQKRFPLADKQLMQVPLPYINGASVKLAVSLAAQSSPFEQLKQFLQ